LREVTLDETTKRAIAIEAALVTLIMELVSEGRLEPPAGLKIFQLLALSSPASADLLREPIEVLSGRPRSAGGKLDG
jgi:hypothetical protein